MSPTSNLRALPITVPQIDGPEAARKWLASQDELVRAVTTVSEAGELFQHPVISEEAFVDPTAVLMGGIVVRPGCYIGPYAVVRLDEKPSPAPLVLGQESNIQDCAVVHSTTQAIGRRVIVAHQAVVHGAIVEDDVAIYIQAVVDGNGTVLGRGCFLHQGSYVGKGIRVPAGRYVAPGVKILTQAEADALPEVPEALVHLREHVLEHNRSHVGLHRRALVAGR